MTDAVRALFADSLKPALDIFSTDDSEIGKFKQLMGQVEANKLARLITTTKGRTFLLGGINTNKGRKWLLGVHSLEEELKKNRSSRK